MLYAVSGCMDVCLTDSALGGQRDDGKTGLQAGDTLQIGVTENTGAWENSFFTLIYLRGNYKGRK